MGNYPALRDYLTKWAGSDARKAAVADATVNLANAGVELSQLIAQAPLAGIKASRSGAAHSELDLVAHGVVLRALKNSPVTWMGAQGQEPALLNAGAPLVVNVDPLDGSSNIDTNLTLGTIFSILPAEGPAPLLQPGRNQLAAGYIVYGPQTALVLSVGEGTDIFWLDRDAGQFFLGKPNVQIPGTTREYAINGSNFRFWEDPLKAYVTDCMAGADGSRNANFNTRWLGSLAAEAFRIFIRGGIYLYPNDIREGYTKGRLRLLYEVNPIAMLAEQAGGACTTGTERVLDIVPGSMHQRVPVVFGSKSEVEEIAHYYRDPHSLGGRSPLFGQRGLFRTVGN
ncbi:MAG: class 1 fructose-bisphosphatase [Rhodomicrobium sp.]